MTTKIFLATGRGLVAITGSAGHWRGNVQLENKQISCVARDLNRKGMVYCGTYGDGLYRSEDDGATWNRCDGFPHPNVTAIIASDSGEVYAGTEPSAVFRSDDRGETWHELHTLLTLPSAKGWSFPPRPHTHHVQSIVLDSAKPAGLHVAVEAGALLRSDDAGATWRDRVPSGPRDTHSLAVHPHEPARLHSAAGDGYFESLDSGDSWRRLVDGLEHGYCWSVAISPAAAATMLLSAAKSAYAAHYREAASSVVYRRRGNEDWQRVRLGLPEPEGLRIPVLAASGAESGVFYLAAEGKVYRSADDGVAWQQLTVEWPGDAVVEHATSMAIWEQDQPV